MRITAAATSRPGEHRVRVATDGTEKPLAVPPREGAPGSAVNGGELLLAALATCYCNDVYREARKLGIAVTRVNVEVWGEFGAEGDPARSLSYRASVEADATPEEIRKLLVITDQMAEIQRTVREGVQITFEV